MASLQKNILPETRELHALALVSPASLPWVTQAFRSAVEHSDSRTYTPQVPLRPTTSTSSDRSSRPSAGVLCGHRDTQRQEARQLLCSAEEWKAWLLPQCLFTVAANLLFGECCL